MIIPGYFDTSHKLQEGSCYRFNYRKKVLLSDENEYMVFEDPFGINHLLPLADYMHYNLVCPSVVTCLVSRINCTGRVFLEPLHPVYRIGTIHSFEITGNAFRDGKRFLCTKDVFGNPIDILTDTSMQGLPPAGTEIECRVTTLKKGKPELSLVSIPAK